MLRRFTGVDIADFGCAFNAYRRGAVEPMLGSIGRQKFTKALILSAARASSRSTSAMPPATAGRATRRCGSRGSRSTSSPASGRSRSSGSAWRSGCSAASPRSRSPPTASASGSRTRTSRGRSSAGSRSCSCSASRASSSRSSASTSAASSARSRAAALHRRPRALTRVPSRPVRGLTRDTAPADRSVALRTCAPTALRTDEPLALLGTSGV